MMSFGQLSRWYSNLADRALRNRIADPLGLPETVLVPLIRHVTDIRNICAHHGGCGIGASCNRPSLAQKPQDLLLSLDQSATQAPAKLYNGLTMIAHVVRTVAAGFEAGLPTCTRTCDASHGRFGSDGFSCRLADTTDVDDMMIGTSIASTPTRSRCNPNCATQPMAMVTGSGQSRLRAGCSSGRLPRRAKSRLPRQSPGWPGRSFSRWSIPGRRAN